MEKGLVKDWDLFESILDFTVKKFVTKDNDLPFVLTEAAWAPTEDRKKLAELLFEKHQIPATYVAKSQVCAAFAHGKSTALVVDSGATHTSVVPIIDGIVLKKSIKQNNMGAHHVQMCVERFAEKKAIDLAVWKEIASKEKVEPGSKPKFTKHSRTAFSKSWLCDQKEKLLDDCVRNFVKIASSADLKDEENQKADNRNKKSFEFPSGYTHTFGFERFQIAESLFTPEDRFPSEIGISSLLTSSINSCDPDIRPTLLTSSILVGGNSILDGFGERLIADMQKKSAPALKFRICNSGKSWHNDWERQFASWTGASILASLATLNDLWITKEHYEEEGMRMFDRKCY